MVSSVFIHRYWLHLFLTTNKFRNVNVDITCLSSRMLYPSEIRQALNSCGSSFLLPDLSKCRNDLRNSSSWSLLMPFESRVKIYQAHIDHRSQIKLILFVKHKEICNYRVTENGWYGTATNLALKSVRQNINIHKQIAGYKTCYIIKIHHVEPR